MTSFQASVNLFSFESLFDSVGRYIFFPVFHRNRGRPIQRWSELQDISYNGKEKGSPYLRNGKWLVMISGSKFKDI